jgi:hypothetical protein
MTNFEEQLTEAASRRQQKMEEFEERKRQEAEISIQREQENSSEIALIVEQRRAIAEYGNVCVNLALNQINELGISPKESFMARLPLIIYPRVKARGWKLTDLVDRTVTIWGEDSVYSRHGIGLTTKGHIIGWWQKINPSGPLLYNGKKDASHLFSLPIKGDTQQAVEERLGPLLLQIINRA